MLVGLMADAVLDPAFATVLPRPLPFARRAALREVLERARDRGEIGGEEDLELLIDVAFGVFWYRLLIGHAALATPRASSSPT